MEDKVKIVIVLVGLVGLLGAGGRLGWVRAEEIGPKKTEIGTTKEQQVVVKDGGWPGRRVVKWAVGRGVAPSTIVLLLLLPLVATVVSVVHYVIGLSGYGMFMPTMMAVTFLATGVGGGLLLLSMILLVSILSGMVLKRFKWHFWPVRAINLLLISILTFGLMVSTSYVQWIDISDISIFPVLIMVMLSEEFVRTQLIKSREEAVKLTVGTLVLAVAGAIIMNARGIQELVLAFPEITILLVMAVNLVVGNYKGMRLTEIRRFRKAIRKNK